MIFSEVSEGLVDNSKTIWNALVCRSFSRLDYWVSDPHFQAGIWPWCWTFINVFDSDTVFEIAEKQELIWSYQGNNGSNIWNSHEPTTWGNWQDELDRSQRGCIVGKFSFNSKYRKSVDQSIMERCGLRKRFGKRALWFRVIYQFLNPMMRIYLASFKALPERNSHSSLCVEFSMSLILKSKSSIDSPDIHARAVPMLWKLRPWLRRVLFGYSDYNSVSWMENVQERSVLIYFLCVVFILC